MEFPKICPAVIIGVTDGDKILMSKYAGRTYKKYALLAGFTEIGETLEETVQREVMEEVQEMTDYLPELEKGETPKNVYAMWLSDVWGE